MASCSPAPSRSDRETLGAQRFHPQLCAWSFGTSRPRYHCPLLPFPVAGQQGLPRWLVSHFCLWRPVCCSDRGWVSFHLDLRQMTSHPGWGWKTFHPSQRWTAFHLNQGLVGLCPVTSQRLQWLESRLGSALVGEVDH